MSSDLFVSRHIGPRDHELPKMLETIGVDSLGTLIDKTVPEAIRLQKPLRLPKAMSEFEYLNHIRKIGSKNKLFRSFIGQGYYGVAPLSVIIRNVLENPSWYTSYTPYQAEISQGRLEALLNFQTMIIELTGMQIANASLLDESTAAAEAMIMMFNARSRASVKAGANKFFVDEDIFLQNLDVIKTRSEPLGIELITGKFNEAVFNESFFGTFVQYPAASGQINDYTEFTEKAHSAGMLVGVAADLMSLTLLTPPGEWGADIVTGSSQRFGLPMSFGGPHAGFFATRDELKRSMPGRIIGVSVDGQGNQALRMALQTREQHIKRERATSNICTAQALLATMSGMYAQYHGPEGLKSIATHIHRSACTVAGSLKKLGYFLPDTMYFDTIRVIPHEGISQDDIRKLALAAGMNFYYPDDSSVSISTDEVTSLDEINAIIEVFAKAAGRKADPVTSFSECNCFDQKFKRKSSFLKAAAFNRYHSETEMMRFIKMLERKDFSLTHCMISLGSCTMKLNPATSMFAMSWPEFGNVHPFVPKDQASGYYQLMDELGEALKEITGFSAISFQPNSGAAGEYTGLMVIREYHKSRGEGHRKVALIPSSAHGTNPASAVMAGMQVVVVECDENGNINVEDLQKKAEENKALLACFMITYPSTHGVFEAAVTRMIDIIHSNGGLVYMDGANMNAQVGLTSPGHIGADVCHLNLHKTFAIPHGGGGPGMGPILTNDRLAEFLPSHPIVKTGGSHGTTAVAGAPFGSGQVLTISHAYIMMMGTDGLTMATRYAILNANYISASLKNWYKTLYTGTTGFVAHELILDCRNFKAEAGINESDIAKRLMDYGFHAPTLSFPVHGTLMIEPTESESLQELDKFIDALKSIWNEIGEIKDGKADKEDNVLHNAPHTARVVTANEWTHGYDRQKAAYPLKWVVENKFWPSVGRIDDGYGDRNLVCTCDPIDSYRQLTKILNNHIMRRSIIFLISMMLLASCGSGGQKKQTVGQTPETMENNYLVKLLTVDPGHFHAALVQKTMYPQVSPRVRVYAPEGPDVGQHLTRISSYNTRTDNPTSWIEIVYNGDDFFEKMLSENAGNVVVLSGNNRKKAEYITRSINAGLNVLADKPMIISPGDFPKLEEAFNVARNKGILLYDIMTERYEITTILQKLLSQQEVIFGKLETGTREEPAVSKVSVHHFSKIVSGSPLQRPAWFFDVDQQGEGIVDVTTHLVDLVQWECFPEQILSPSDVNMAEAKRWPTVITKEEFKGVTGYEDFPEFLQKDIKDGKLNVYSNGEMIYQVKGIWAKVSVNWNYMPPAGGGDTHYSVMRGSKCDLIIRQGADEKFLPTLYIEKIKGMPVPDFITKLNEVLGRLPYDSLKAETVDTKTLKVIIPKKYRVSHEEHFGQVTARFLDYMKEGKLPDWEVPGMITKYYTTTSALKLAKE